MGNNYHRTKTLGEGRPCDMTGASHSPAVGRYKQ